MAGSKEVGLRSLQIVIAIHAVHRESNEARAHNRIEPALTIRWLPLTCKPTLLLLDKRERTRPNVGRPCN